jgi:arylsulfatase A-like enzyme
MEGRSFLALLSGRADGLPSVPAITEAAWTRLHKVSIRQDGFKYIVDLWQGASPQDWCRELYDLQADPQESRNFARESQQHEDVLARFEEILESHLARVRANQPERADEQIGLSDAVVSRLRSLGYLD